MYLKSLHIQGFKTFEQSTTLELSYPVIAIVGPNGSGKSNLVDALRWTPVSYTHLTLPTNREV